MTIGSLTNEKSTFSWAAYYIDDIELYKLNDTIAKCDCEIINKDLRNLYNREFPINKKISNDTLVMYAPIGPSPGIITPPAKFYLHNIIAFMQRNPSVKIRLIQHDWFSNTTIKPTQTYYYVNYLRFFGISNDRISEISGECEDKRSIYCGHGASYVKIGFEFYK